VLAAGGRLVLATVHPVNSAGAFAGKEPDSPFVINGSYLHPSRNCDTFSRDGLTMTFNGAHRPLQDYTEALAGAGFVIERLREPTSTAAGQPWLRVPLFLHIVARL
jgi:hypothetical protein